MIQSATTARSNEVKEIPIFNNLPKRIVDYLLAETHIEHRNAGEGIVAIGEATNQIYYLLKGEVAITSQDGKRLLCQADQSCALAPLAEKSPSMTDIISVTAVDLLSISRELHDSVLHLPKVLNRHTNKAIELSDAATPEDSFFWEFHEAITNNTLELPSMPDITMRIAKVINEGNSDSEDIAHVLQADPTVAAKIISVVNSAAYRGKHTIDNLPDAVTRLGRSVTHNLVISFALGKLFHSHSRELKQRMLKLWKHLSYVAPICHELAVVTPGLAPDQAMLCGLLHDIGGLAIIGAARSKPELVENPEMLDQIIAHLKGEVGAMVLRKWAFPDYFIQAALHSDDWMQDISSDADYVDIVIVAQLHAYVGTPMMAHMPRLDLVPAFHKLALGKLTPRHSIGILENAKDRVRELQNLLAGAI